MIDTEQRLHVFLGNGPPIGAAREPRKNRLRAALLFIVGGRATHENLPATRWFLFRVSDLSNLMRPPDFETVDRGGVVRIPL